MINNKILIVDDEPDICDLISDILSDSGYSVKSAFSKDEAITELTKQLDVEEAKESPSTTRVKVLRIRFKTCGPIN